MKILIAIGVVAGGALLAFLAQTLLGREQKPRCSTSEECGPCDPLDVHAHQARIAASRTRPAK